MASGSSGGSKGTKKAGTANLAKQKGEFLK